ncbi:hypothetical protein [Acinetobacter sp. LMB-5]|uniref:hypothetical protein n=1 Tax=Acinetobacter sp. LMB-5 TaxID=1609919 RepID=UPI000761E0E4|nr:hypothetical protein [Acinetobacter sp. LMB-5]
MKLRIESNMLLTDNQLMLADSVYAVSMRKAVICIYEGTNPTLIDCVYVEQAKALFEELKGFMNYNNQVVLDYGHALVSRDQITGVKRVKNSLFFNNCYSSFNVDFQSSGEATRQLDDIVNSFRSELICER